MGDRGSILAQRELVLERLREDRQIRARHAREPRRRRARLARRDAGPAERARQGHRDVHLPRGSAAPREYGLFSLEGLIQQAPADIAQRTVVFLDCGNIDRNSASVLRDGARLLNIDHHHDNTNFGTLNYVVADASCTAEIVWDLMHGLGWGRRRRSRRPCTSA